MREIIIMTIINVWCETGLYIIHFFKSFQGCLHYLFIILVVAIIGN